MHISTYLKLFIVSMHGFISISKRLGRLRLRSLPSSSQIRLSTGSSTTTFFDAFSGGESNETGDVLITGLNGNQDISVKVVSCREVVQEAIIKNDLSPQAAKALGEVLTCGLMMGSGLKGEETLQINLVGNSGIRNVMAITDGDLKIRGMVGQPQFRQGTKLDLSTGDLLGTGQVQIVRNHPSYKQPMNGIVLLRDTKIPLNLALYMAESEQRSAVLLTDVFVEGNLCRRALGVMVERLPGATEENIETSIRNLEIVEQKGLARYLTRSDEERSQDGGMFRDFSSSLGKILDDCLSNMGEDLRWSKQPKYRCGCGVEKVWRALRLIPVEEVRLLVEQEDDVEVKCEFCGVKYSVSKDEIRSQILALSSD